MAMINLSKEATVGKALTPIAILMMLSFPVASQAAGLVIKNGTVYNANGVPVVDINKPNGSGLSHNIWDNLNVDKMVSFSITALMNPVLHLPEIFRETVI